MTTLKCQNCGGTVELNSELPVAFCPYCGAKSLIDEKSLSQVYAEKEKTKRVSIHETEKTKREELEAHNQTIGLYILGAVILFSLLYLCFH
jgi:DNA-directed RNA polymerase subunit RPC12/RpoP